MQLQYKAAVNVNASYLQHRSFNMKDPGLMPDSDWWKLRFLTDKTVMQSWLVRAGEHGWEDPGRCELNKWRRNNRQRLEMNRKWLSEWCFEEQTANSDGQTQADLSLHWSSLPNMEIHLQKKYQLPVMFCVWGLFFFSFPPPLHVVKQLQLELYTACSHKGPNNVCLKTQRLIHIHNYMTYIW